MALSDKLFTLATRAKEAEEKATELRGKTRAELQAAVDKAQASAKKSADSLHAKFEKDRGMISESWDHARNGLHERVAATKGKIESVKLEHDKKRAVHHADRAEVDAAYAIDFAYAAIEEAESEVLDALYARQHANELASPVSV